MGVRVEFPVPFERAGDRFEAGTDSGKTWQCRIKTITERDALFRTGIDASLEVRGRVSPGSGADAGPVSSGDLAWQDTIPAIEAAVDRQGEEPHELSGRAKDLGSAAVLLSLLLVAAVWMAVAADRFLF
jgi:hypothetical protein